MEVYERQLEPETDEKSRALSFQGLKAVIERLRERIHMSGAVDTEHEYVFPYSVYHGPVAPSIDMIRGQLELRNGKPELPREES